MTRFVSPQKRRQSSLGSKFNCGSAVASGFARREFAIARVHFLFQAHSSFAESEVDENYEDKAYCHDCRQKQEEQGGII
jgi:hypothetical protein